MQQYPSQLLEKSICEFSKLPGVGRKTALRFVLHLLRQSQEEVDEFSDAISKMAIENTQQYNGLYHVLGGIISPIDGIGPSDLEIESLVERVKDSRVKEIILALSSTMEGDTTNFYIARKLKDFDTKLSIISRGISVGDELEYTDEVTLGRSILNRTLLEP